MKKIFPFLLVLYLFSSLKAESQNTFELSFGDAGNDYVRCVTPLFKGGYVACGYTSSFGAGNIDAFLVKTDLTGNITWLKTFGGSGVEASFNVIQTSDKGFALVGSTLNGSFGSDDIFVIKTDSDGNVQWDKFYGTIGNDQGYDIRETPSGGYIVAGFTTDASGFEYDAYVLRISSAGDLLWSKIFGNSFNEGVYTIAFAANGNYVFAGKSEMNSNGGADYLLTEIDTSGNIIWMKNYGGIGYDVAIQVRRTTDDGFILSGYSDSYTTGGNYDLLAIKTDSAGNLDWTHNYHQSGVQYSGGAVQASDGGYYFSGCTNVNGTYDVFLLRTDSDGNITWANTYQHGGATASYAFNFKESNNNLLCFGGYTAGGSSDDALMIVSDLAGNAGSECMPESTDFTVTSPNDIVVATPDYVLSSNGSEADAGFITNDYTPVSSVLCLATAVVNEETPLSEIYANGNTVYIKNIRGSDEFTATIYNTLGQLIYRSKTSGPLSTIDMGNVPSGIYIVKVAGNDQSMIQEVLIQQ